MSERYRYQPENIELVATREKSGKIIPNDAHLELLIDQNCLGQIIFHTFEETTQDIITHFPHDNETFDFSENNLRTSALITLVSSFIMYRNWTVNEMLADLIDPK